MSRFLIVFGMAFMLLAPVARAGQDVVNTRHNLSVSGPGTIKSATITQVCVFCHTPHNALPDAQLWNHLPTAETNYIMYDSSTLKTAVLPADQPTGKSRLCLACHDGTIALGALQNPPDGVTNDLAATLMTGRGDLTTDLSNDHPISFAYDAALFGTTGAELHDPSGLAAAGLPLEGDQLQCTTCHDPHEKDLAPFLRLTTADGTLCTTCHDKTGWAGSTHQNSTAAVAAADLDNRRPEWVQPTVAGNACLSCHAPHNAVNPERLIAKDGENTCYGCHDGTPASDIQGEFAKTGGIHPVADPLYAGLHDATKVEDAAGMPLHVECMDCHNPHTVTPGALPMVSFNPNDPTNNAIHTAPPAANSLIQGVTGLDINGAPTASVTYQYELCFKCHGRIGQDTCGTDRCGAPQTHGMIRQDMINGPPDLGGTPVDRSIRDRVVPGGGVVSWHPLYSNNGANNAEVPSLRTDIPAKINATDAIIYCTDCHNSDASAAAGGTGPDGPHGSSTPTTLEGMLALGYVLDINSSASDTASFALCYKCHDELTIKSTASFSKHDAHLGNRQGSCVKCHDPHGSFAYPRLLNFLWWSDGQIVIDCIRGKGGGTQPCDTSDGFSEPGWVDGPGMTGLCYLSCHGTGHAGKTY
jgi:predicted CXXCH cytochrome family protein